MADKFCELIVYACPLGKLARQLNTYFESARKKCGPNAAHRFPPHVSLTGFFHDEPTTVAYYSRALGQVVMRGRNDLSPHVAVREVVFGTRLHRLEIESPWLKRIADDFQKMAKSRTRADPIRIKKSLHLSLAYEFSHENVARLKALGRAISFEPPSRWEVRLYERLGMDEWRCHAQFAP